MERRLYHSDYQSEALDFVADHPAIPAARDVAEFYLAKLLADSSRAIDLWNDGRRVGVSVLIDTCNNASNSAELVILGLEQGTSTEAALKLTFDEAEALTKTGPRSCIEVCDFELIPQFKSTVDQRHYFKSYQTIMMDRKNDVAFQGALPALPNGWS